MKFSSRYTFTVATEIWRQVFKWMDIAFINSDTVQEHFIQFGDFVKGKTHKKFWHIIWLATT
jgi:hypothetical protein